MTFAPSGIKSHDGKYGMSTPILRLKRVYQFVGDPPRYECPNPWSAMAQADQGNVNAAGNAASNIPQAQMRLSGQVDQMNKYGMSTQAPQTGYPASK